MPGARLFVIDIRKYRLKQLDSAERVLLVGAVAGGKSTLARKWAASSNLPLFHHDSLQFLPGWKIEKSSTLFKELDNITAGSRWMLDGCGAKYISGPGIDAADLLVFFDLAPALHYLFMFHRQMLAGVRPRAELPEDCSEFNLHRTIANLKVLRLYFHELRPALVEILMKRSQAQTVLHVQTLAGRNHLMNHFLPKSP